MFARGVAVAVLACAWVGCVCPGVMPEVSALDGGAPDAGAPDAGEVDAGPLDAGVPDSGSRDAGPEVCNGLDDDLDGVVDDEADGGLLARPCPLTLGVCLTARSYCVDGGWAACDYGPDYQRTERRCDGLDNDCDGTVDSSWTRVLLEADAGRFGNLMMVDIDYAKIVPGTQNHWLSLPNDLLIINDDLEPTGHASFPRLSNGHAYLFPHEAGWVRVANEFHAASPLSARLVLHRVFTDGGFDLEPDGGVRAFADPQVPAPFSNFRAVSVDGGWLVVMGRDFFGQPPDALGWWHRIDVDGGLTGGLLDGGIVSGAYPVPGLASSGQTFLFTTHSNATGSTDVYEADLSTSTLRWRVSVSGWCAAVGAAPLVVRCGYPASIWSDEFGHALFTSSTALQVFSPDGLTDPHFIVMDPGAGWDGGDEPERVVVEEVRDGGAVPFLELTGAPERYSLQAHDLGGRLVLVTWGAHHVSGVCPTCEIGQWLGRYACLPP